MSSASPLELVTYNLGDAHPSEIALRHYGYSGHLLIQGFVNSLPHMFALSLTNYVITCNFSMDFELGTRALRTLSNKSSRLKPLCEEIVNFRQMLAQKIDDDLYDMGRLVVKLGLFGTLINELSIDENDEETVLKVLSQTFYVHIVLWIYTETSVTPVFSLQSDKAPVLHLERPNDFYCVLVCESENDSKAVLTPADVMAKYQHAEPPQRISTPPTTEELTERLLAVHDKVLLELSPAIQAGSREAELLEELLREGNSLCEKLGRDQNSFRQIINRLYP